MVAAAIIVIAIIVLGTVAFAWGLRRVVRDESVVENRLRAPNAHTVSYALPNGVDPGAFRVAVTRGGFTSIVATSGTRECLLVECEDGDRARLRHLIEDIHETAYDGSDLDLHPVVFEDES
jgi:hypothetical protein